MPFLKQADGKNNCGAYCMCYLEWLNENRTPDAGPKPGDQGEVDEVYRHVQLGNAAIPGLLPPDYCDPVKMIGRLREKHEEVSFFLTPGTDIDKILEAMKAPGQPEKDDIDRLTAEGKIQKVPPQPPEKEEAAIAVYYVVDPRAKLSVGMHYILFCRDKEGRLHRYNPWDGEAARCDGYDPFAYPNESARVYTLAPAGAAILIKK